MQTATTLAAADLKAAPATIARRAADIADACYLERVSRNAADLAAAEAAETSPAPEVLAVFLLLLT